MLSFEPMDDVLGEELLLIFQFPLIVTLHIVWQLVNNLREFLPARDLKMLLLRPLGHEDIMNVL